MPPPDPASHADTVALFRYGLIADLLHLPAGDRSLHTRLREKAAREYDIPGTTRRRVAAETLRDWLYAYRRAGFDGFGRCRGAVATLRPSETGGVRRSESIEGPASGHRRWPWRRH
jgi:hypothetical protein